jgi:uncharacterized protein (TIGR02145 family)
MNTPFRFITLIAIGASLTGCGETSTDKALTPAEQVADTTTQKAEAITPPVAAPSIPTIAIGDQEWMTADINATTYNNGDAIAEANSAKQWSGFAAKKEGCYRKLANGTILYNGYAMTDARGIVPAGFQIPTSDDFKKLMKFLGAGSSQTGKATKAMANYSITMEEWDDSIGDFKNQTVKGAGADGFNAQKGGFVYEHGDTGGQGSCSFWWTSTESGNDYGVVDIGYCSQDLGGGSGSYSTSYGFAVRGIKK